MTGWGIKGGEDLRRISAELRRQGNGREVAKKFRRELRAAAAPMVPAVRASIARIPSKQERGRGEGLRAALQKATRLEVRTVGRVAGVRIRVDGRKMPPGQGKLPAYMEGTAPRWRHPVFQTAQNPDTWVTQPPHAYFYPVVRPLGARSRVAVAKVISEINREIT